jgi:transcriptional regulator with XRE-family HTH domain
MFWTTVEERMDVCQVAPSASYIQAVPEPVTPWFQAVEQLRAKTGLSQDDLAFEARRHGAPSTLTGSWISQLKSGKRPLSIDILYGLAGALGVEPEHFIEYRLAVARCWLDENEVGLEVASRMLDQVKDAKGLAEDPGDAVRANRAVQAASAAREATQRSHQRSPGKRASTAKTRRAG